MREPIRTRNKQAIFEGLVRQVVLVIGGILITAGVSPAISVSVSPSSVTIPVSSTRQLTAYSSAPVVWSVNGLIGGNATVGTVSTNGLYAAPAVPPAGYTVTVKATSKVNANAFDTCAVTVRNQIPWLTALYPSSLVLGSFTLQVSGSRFVAGAQVLWNGAALPTVFNSSTLLTATGNATAAGTVNISVANPGPAAVSSTLPLTVRAATASPTNTSLPSATRTATAKPSETRTATHTATAVPTETRTPTMAPPTATPSLPPTATRTATMAMATWTPSQIAATATSTSGEPSRTATIAATRTPTMAATSATATAAAPTATAPTPDPQAISIGRFLEQTTFGPSATLTAHLAQVGIYGFLDEQFALPESPWPALSTATRSAAVDAFFANALAGEDQLRQRVIFALSEVIVEAMNKNTNGDEIVPWLQLLSRNAFGNYLTLLKELTLDASMGKYLDLANSGVMGGAANENYPREVMQLFSIGLYQLNLDGSVQVDAQNVGLPTYTQTDVQQLAKALTGWTYGNATGTPPTSGNSNYYPGPMLPVASRHNTSAKTILGQSLPANQSAQKDLDDAIGIIFNHPNVGPFLATRLIRGLVTSNPSPAYIARVATVFNDNGNGVRGDMQAVLRAIVLDSEARNDTPPANFGRLRTPVQHTIALARALGLNLGAASQFAYLFYGMNEGMLDAASVFGHYSPSYRIPKTALFGPEFQIYSASDAVNRANWFYSLLYNPWPINPVLQPFVAVAGSPTALVDAVDKALLFGRMTASTRSALLTALPAMPDNNARVLTAVYLTATSGESLVQR